MSSAVIQALAVADQANYQCLQQAGLARQPVADLQQCSAMPEQLPPTGAPECQLGYGFVLSSPQPSEAQKGKAVRIVCILVRHGARFG